MAEPYTDVTSAMVENMKGFDRINADVLRTGWESVAATKDARHDITASTSASFVDLSRQVDAIDDTISANLVGLNRDSADIRAQIMGLTFQVRDGFIAAAKDSEINGLKTQVELAKQSVYLSDKIDGQSERTRELINELKNADLNRYLIERTSELVELRGEGRYWHGNYNQSQFAAVHNQMQNLGSQLQEARQGTVNFGTMSGNAGRNTSTNNVV